jgi:type II restriction/modification system DNA methylase subunit YeeA
MGKLHDILQKAGYVGHELEIYLTRLMFCLFAEDTGIFGHNQFTDYIKASKDVSARPNSLFNVLNEPHKAATMSEEFRNFPYINGDLFRESSRTLYITDDMRDMLLECASIYWSHVSPAIFGTMF